MLLIEENDVGKLVADGLGVIELVEVGLGIGVEL